MKQILIVEDNKAKEAQMRSALDALSGFEFTVCRSIKAAYPLLEAHQWDLILLDMSFQVNQDAGTEIKKKPLAGRQILQFMRARGLVRPVIVVTQNASFSEGHTTIDSISDLDQKLRKYFPGIYQGTVFVDLANELVARTIDQLREKGGSWLANSEFSLSKTSRKREGLFEKNYSRAFQISTLASILW